MFEVTLDSEPATRHMDPTLPSIFRYHEFMPFDADPSLFGLETIARTPEFVDESISESLDVEIVIKDETVMPTGTWKDREGFVSLHRLTRNGISDLMIFSSGNTGTSLARSASIFKGPRVHMVIPEESATRVGTAMAGMDPEFVKLRFAPGSNDECIAEAGRVAKENGYTIEGGFANYARREGLKLLGLEHIWESSLRCDWYAQPIAGGIGVYSFYKAHRESGRDCPRMLGVQAEICAPMVRAWREGAPSLESRHIPDYVPSPFVRVLRTRNPGDSYRVLKGVMDGTAGAFEAVSDAEILAGLRTFYRSDYFKARYHRDGMTVGLEPATALAGVAKAARTGVIAKGSRVLLNVSGAAKKGDVELSWIADLLR
jgi:threonine synthase